ncbi:MAG: glycosyltransferase family 39 protein, partial [Fimbriimonadales bacterium]|nr:glycosyltransferase family 39 protein [Fimbriimonadales bacterium]
MAGLLMGLAIGLLAIGAGMLLLRRLSLPFWEGVAYGGALGLGLLAYGVALFAALHWLSGLWLLLGVTAAAGLWGWVSTLRQVEWTRPIHRMGLASLAWGLLGALLLLGLVLCLLPPDGNEWDALAYHLAFPKLYLQAGGMVEIPFMHQSYFPPLLDMLYLLGLWLDGEPCAKVFHWLMALLMVTGTVAFVARLGGQGLWSALLLMGTPVILWQSFSAYIDLATAFYVALGAFALACAIKERVARWLWLAGVMMGFALATKYTALLSWGLWGLIGLAWCWRERWGQGVRLVVLTGLLALALGAPGYLRNWLWTGNPVYPFAYELFGGKNWSREQAIAYRGDQLKFGMGREPAQLLTLPWNLTAHPFYFADPIGATVGEQVYLLPSTGMGYLATLGLIAGAGLTAGAGWLLGLVGLNMLGWFYMMQQVRYLIVVFPLFAAAGTARAHLAPRWLRGAYGALLSLQAFYTLWLFGNAYLPYVPLALRDREAYLERRLQIYPAVRFLNTQTSADKGVILLDETRGYYLDRRYLWGNPGHHRLIPYERFG